MYKKENDIKFTDFDPKTINDIDIYTYIIKKRAISSLLNSRTYSKTIKEYEIDSAKEMIQTYFDLKHINCKNDAITKTVLHCFHILDYNIDEFIPYFIYGYKFLSYQMIEVVYERIREQYPLTFETFSNPDLVLYIYHHEPWKIIEFIKHYLKRCDYTRFSITRIQKRLITYIARKENIQVDNIFVLGH